MAWLIPGSLKFGIFAEAVAHEADEQATPKFVSAGSQTNRLAAYAPQAAIALSRNFESLPAK